jgi:hypothetical protein
MCWFAWVWVCLCYIDCFCVISPFGSSGGNATEPAPAVRERCDTTNNGDTLLWDMWIFCRYLWNTFVIVVTCMLLLLLFLFRELIYYVVFIPYSFNLEYSTSRRLLLRPLQSLPARSVEDQQWLRKRSNGTLQRKYSRGHCHLLWGVLSINEGHMCSTCGLGLSPYHFMTTQLFFCHFSFSLRHCVQHGVAARF